MAFTQIILSNQQLQLLSQSSSLLTQIINSLQPLQYGPASGDLGGSYPNPTVVKIDGTALSNLNTATDGQSLVWNGAAWAPASIGGAGSVGGDLSGTTTSATVIKINGTSLGTLSGANISQGLTWNGTNWSPQDVAKEISLVTFGADPTGSANCASAFASAFSALSSGGVLHVNGGTFRISTNVTVPNNVTLSFDTGKISIDNGITLTVDGTVEAPGTQIFITAATPSAVPVIFQGAQSSVNALWYGADPTNTTDSTQALANAFIGIAGNAVEPAGNPSAPIEVFIPSGIYKVSGTLGQCVNLRGNNTILMATSNSVDFLTGYTFLGNISGITFYGGNNSISVAAGFVSGIINIDNCQFFENHGACIYTDNECDNVTITVTRGLFSTFSNTTGTILTNNSATVNMTDCGGGHSGTVLFQMNGGILYGQRLNLAPNTSGGYWIDCEGGSVSMTECRFGGEADDKPVVKWNTPPGTLYAPDTIIDTFMIIEKCSLYSDGGLPTNEADFEFYQIPMRLRLSGNFGADFGSRLYFDPGIPLDQRQQIREIFQKDWDVNDNKNTIAPQSDPVIVDQYLGQNSENSNTLTAADYALVIPGASSGFGAQQGQTGGTVLGSGTDMFGVPTSSVTTTGSTGSFFRNYTTALAGLAAGPYTLSIQIAACTQRQSLAILVGSITQTIVVQPGKSVINIPFYKAFADPSNWATSTSYSAGNKVLNSNSIWVCTTGGTSASTGSGPSGSGQPGLIFTESTGVIWEWIGTLTIGFSASSIATSTTLAWGRTIVLNGHPQTGTQNSIIYGSAAPSSGQWFIGDICYNTAPSLTSTPGWVCTASGTPGTWSAMSSVGQISLINFGADPTGTTDCSAAFSAALTALSAGGTLYVNNGTFKLAGNINVPANVALSFSSAIINVQNTYTLNIYGSIQAPNGNKILEGAGAINILQGPISVRWFGATGNGSTDDTAAIQAAMNAADASGGGTDSPFARPIVWFPAGTYDVSSAITVGSACDVRGEQSLINATVSSNNIFQVGTFRGTIRDLQFIGGAIGIDISTGNVDTDDIKIENCRFFDQTVSCIKTEANSNSTLLLVKRCLFYNGIAGSNIFYGITADYVVFDDCWITFGGTSGDVAFHNTGCVLYLNDILGVPGVSGVTWVECDGGQLVADRIRFGGESVDGVCVKWSTPASLPGNVGVIDSFLTVKNSSCYTADESHTIQFYTIPNSFVFENNTGLQAGSQGFYFDASIPIESRSALNTYCKFTFSNEINRSAMDCGASDPEIVNRVLAGNFLKSNQLLQSGDLVFQTVTPTSSTGIGGTGSGYTDPYGLTGGLGFTVTDYTILNFQIGLGINMSSSPAGDYEAVYHIEIQGGPINGQFYAMGVPYQKALEIGHNIVHIPFSIPTAVAAASTWASGTVYSVGNIVKDTDGNSVWVCKIGGTSAVGGDPSGLGGSGSGYTVTDSNGVKWEWVCGFKGFGFACFYAPNGAFIGQGRLRIFNHHPDIDSINTQILGTAAPSSGSWYLGDTVYNTTVTSGSNIGWICTTAGTPGTWSQFGQGVGAGVLVNPNPVATDTLAVGGGLANEVTISGTGTGTDPTIVVSGDTNRNLVIEPAGTGRLWVTGPSTAGGLTLGQYNSSNTFSGMWFGPPSGATNTNYIIAADAANANLNGGTEVSLCVGGNNIANATSSQFQVVSVPIVQASPSTLELFGNVAATSATSLIVSNLTTQTSGDIIAFYNGGTAQAYFDYLGNLGIGSSSSVNSQINFSTGTGYILWDTSFGFIIGGGPVQAPSLESTTSVEAATYVAVGTHLASINATPPTVASFHANFGTVTSAAVVGADAAGIISFTTGTATTIGANSALCTVSLANPYGSTSYVVMISNATASGALDTSAYYAVPNATNTFIIYNNSSITPGSTTTYKLQFITIGAGTV